jgi:hypothetical protein
MSPDSHSTHVNKGDGFAAFVDGIPDQCAHIWNGDEILWSADEERELQDNFWDSND